MAWGTLDLEGAVLRVEYSMEETRAGLKLKPPKTRHGRRSIALPAYDVEALRAHLVQHLEERLALGLGRPGGDDLVFTLSDGSPRVRTISAAVGDAQSPPSVYRASDCMAYGTHTRAR